MRAPIVVCAYVFASCLGASAIAEEKDQQSKEIAPKNETSTEEPQYILLKDIWGYENMPSTKDAFELGMVKDSFGVRSNPVIDSLHIALNKQKKSRKKEPVLPAFVVEGTGEAALRSMAAVLEANKEPKKDFPTGRELSLIFHTYFISLGLRLDPVEKTGNKYTIPYQMIGSEGYSVSVMYHYFAIIPLGDKLPPGEYEIVIEQLPTVDEFGGKIIHRSDLQWIVCSNGNFEVYINKDKK